MSKKNNNFQPRSYPKDEIAFVMCSTQDVVTFGELEDRANQGAQFLRSLGVQKCDHIAILLENRREFIEICFAADRCGIYYTTISTHLKENEVSYIVADCAAKVLIVTFSCFLCENKENITPLERPKTPPRPCQNPQKSKNCIGK